ncbi:MAG: hypothetical protein ISS73_02760 [Pirellulales bacterium]|nr:hypothetical protein [Pirellulales bacterium]MDA0970085.1 hypothetical protein [Planctomycetota bacterium]
MTRGSTPQLDYHSSPPRLDYHSSPPRLDGRSRGSRARLAVSSIEAA